MVDVVVMNHDVDVLDALRTAVEAAGFTVAARLAHGSVEDLAAFVRDQNARVVVYDLGPPPVAGAIDKWRTLCQQPGADRAYVITTTYPCELDSHRCIVETVLVKPGELGDLIPALRRAMQRTEP